MIKTMNLKPGDIVIDGSLGEIKISRIEFYVEERYRVFGFYNNPKERETERYMMLCHGDEGHKIKSRKKILIRDLL